MPFGEYTPLGNYLPWLREINQTAPDFTAGESVNLFPLPHGKKVAALICYEDVVPSLAREASRAGANILVNLTNDAWFGKTVAPRQHHLIASFRAIENRRFLLRTTNTGLTAIVDPVGETVAELPLFTEGVLSREVKLMDATTLSMIVGEWPWRILSLIALALTAYSTGRRWRRSSP